MIFTQKHILTHVLNFLKHQTWHKQFSFSRLHSNLSTTLTPTHNMRCTVRNLSALNPMKSFNAYVETCVHLLKSLPYQSSIISGCVIHGQLIRIGLSSERHIAVKLLITYLNHRKSVEVEEMLKDFDPADPIVYNCLISASIQSGNLDEARWLFDEMPQRNEISWTALISGFMKFGRVKESLWYFERNPWQNVFSWTAVISGFVRNGLNFEAMKFFRKMVDSGFIPNDITFTSTIRACARSGDFDLGMSVLGFIIKVGFEGNLSVSNSLITLNLRMGEIDLARKIFNEMEKRDVVSWTAILDMFVEIEDLTEAHRIFNMMPERNEISWSLMIARYSQSGFIVEALKLFHEMLQNGFRPTISCFSTVLSAIATLPSVENLRGGTNIHGHAVKIGIEQNVFIGSSLITLYCNNGETENGRGVFDSILEKNVVSWNSMIGGYSLSGQFIEAKSLFEQIPKKDNVSWNTIIAGYLENEQLDKVFEVFNDMIFSGEKPSKSTFSTMLCACSSLASLQKGKNLHGKIIKLGIKYEIYVGTALSDMYAKSGDIESSRNVFDRMPDKNDVSWSMMIQGLATNGFADESLSLFKEMPNNPVYAPNDLTLLAVLFACSHFGLVEKGLHYFNSMESIYGIKPKAQHYTCIVDLLSRSGQLDEAEEFVRTMPIEPGNNARASLLSSCSNYENGEIAQRTAKNLCEMGEKDSSGFVLLSNVYASSGRWVDVSNIRKSMKEKGVRKARGISWIEVRNQVHSFYAEDGSHSHSTEIYWILEVLKLEMVAI